MPNLKEAIEASKKIMLGNDFGMFTKYSPFYLSTNEEIEDCLRNVNYNKSRALSVLSSGDHALHLIGSGVEKIDLFDINELTYYFFLLKIASIKTLSYYNFDNFMRCWSVSYPRDNHLCLLDYLKQVKPALETDAYEYFRELGEFALEHNRNLKLLVNGGFSIGKSGIIDESEYLSLGKKLENVSFQYYFHDAKELPHLLDGMYDIILLSNIGDYVCTSNIEQLQFEPFKMPLIEAAIKDTKDYYNYIQSYLKLLNLDGVIINYFINYDLRSAIVNSLEQKDFFHEFPLQHLYGNHAFQIVRKRIK